MSPLRTVPRWPDFAVLLLIVGVFLGLSRWAGRSVDEEQARALRAAARPGDILMLSFTNCVFCKQASAWLSDQRVPYRECFVEHDAACRAEYQARGMRGTPTFVVRGHTLVGFDRERLRALLTRPIE